MNIVTCVAPIGTSPRRRPLSFAAIWSAFSSSSSACSSGRGVDRRDIAVVIARRWAGDEELLRHAGGCEIYAVAECQREFLSDLLELPD